MDANPALYTTIPPQGERKPGQLTAQQLKQYFDEGFVVVPNFFKPEDLDPVREGVKYLVNQLVNKLYDAGKIKDKHEDVGLFQRFTLIEKQFPGAGVLMHKAGILPQSFRDLWSHDHLLNVMEQLIGPNIAGHPVWNLRVKTPQNEESVVPWHQDNAYLDPNALNVLQPTAWIPLLDVNAQNGCIQVARRGHRKGVTARHQCCVGNTWYVELLEEDMMKTLEVDMDNDLVTCDVPYGGVLFMNNSIPHRSLTNLSNEIRWSLDLRWQRPDKPNGFYGIKESIPMRVEGDPNFKPDFDTFSKTDRQLLTKDIFFASKNTEQGATSHEDDDEFDTTITGPWMQRWEMVHTNRHTARFKPHDKYNWVKA
ncbi:phytanoyl-CoA dioxygenase domain-containing protein 1 homolog [Diadema antillarum]|uniref:phytanoyl-CoA dioxygenase domain-containing protein 1 homolog n=1 Tax=Diadema antillarum TaxID=105358 RepID=UPI003A89788B